MSSSFPTFRPREAFVSDSWPAPSGEELLPEARTTTFDRRSVLKLMGLSAAIPLAACSAPAEEIVPYVTMPEGLVAGKPRYFATAFELEGIATGLLAESHEGRPTKIEGNPDHPASLGGTDAFHQAMVLSLYDPGRASLVRKDRRFSTYDDFLGDLTRMRARWQESDGDGLEILTGAVSSPTFQRLMAALKESFPKLRHTVFEPVGRDNERAGIRLAFGEDGAVAWHPDRAKAIFALDADFLGPGPQQVALARAFGKGRKVRAGSRTMTRLAVAEPVMSGTGATADLRLPLPRSRGDRLLRAMAAALGVPGIVAPDGLEVREEAFVETVAAELRGAGQAALVMVGEAQAPHVHALAHRINAHLGALGETVRILPPIIEQTAGTSAEVLAGLTERMRDDAVQELVIFGANPVYTAPADLDFAGALEAVPTSVHLSLYQDETSEACRWQIPQLHPLEEWSDTQAKSGLVSIVQPLVSPLYEGHSPLSLLAALAGDYAVSSHQAVYETWSQRRSGDGSGEAAQGGFEDFWRNALATGLVPDTGVEEADGAPAGDFSQPGVFDLPPLSDAPPGDGAFEIVFNPDTSVWDGRFSNNAWLQETPRPITSEVWGNAAAMHPADHRALGLRDGSIIALDTSDGQRITIPTMAVPGQARGTIGVTLGYGRTIGSIARGIGTDVYPLRTTDGLWFTEATATPIGAHVALATTQGSHQMEGREIVRTVPLGDLDEGHETGAHFDGEPPTLFPEFERGPYEWAMVIDQTLCIACNACVVACQAENNVPVVGPEEIRRGRDMHWLRIDSYFEGEEDAPRVATQPVPCMHCEKAPCEPMCPVEAAIHDSEGLNVQVYNRCVGTRDCQSNCPYKVRRFNFFGYAAGQEYADLGDPMLNALQNPDVTVRARGVMEKCTYCVQRISGARREATREGRMIAEGEVVTACQQACPTEAISFGNLSEKGSTVNRLREEPHHYALLAELGTRPRTTYLAHVQPEFGAGKAPDEEDDAT